MTLNTAQYLAPLNSQQVLNGYTQGVKEGPGITIQPNGTITLDPTTATTLGFLISSTLPAPTLSWPSTPGQEGAILLTDSSGNLSWSVNYVPTAPAGGTFPQLGAAIIPAGSTGNRPVPADRGYIRYNTDSNNLEWFNGLSWLSVTPPTGTVSSFVDTVTPTALSVGDLWLDENTGLEKVWDGTIWAPTSPLASAIVPGRAQIGANIQVTPAGVISVSSTVGVAGGVSNLGVTAVVDNTGSVATGEALSANQGRLLQAQIAALITSSNITFAGLINGFGILTAVSNAAAAVGFIVGNPLPAPSASNEDFFVICTSAGTFSPPSGSPITVTQGDWLLSTGTSWLFLNVGYDPPIASTTQAGLVELATDAETQAGTDTSRAITPSGLSSRVATDAQTGLVELATVGEVQLGTDNTRAVTPLGLNDRIATEAQTGIAEIATQAEVNAGIDDTRIVTPLKIRTAITSGALNSSNIQLSSPINGNTTVQQALLDAVYNIGSATGEILVTETPTGQIDLNAREATDALTGVTEIATQAEVNAGTDDFRYITPLKLSAYVSGGQIAAPSIPLSPAINGNTNVQTALQDAIYNINSPGSSITVTEAATGLVSLVVAQATETLRGGAEIATQAETNAGLSDTVIVTPLKLTTLINGGAVDATKISLAPSINGNTTVQSALEDAIYDIASANASLTVSVAATGLVTLTSVAATSTLAGVSELATPAEVATGTDTTRTVTPQGARFATVFKSDYTDKGAILSASAASTPVALTVGSDGQYLRADSTQGTGLVWDTISAGDLVVAPAINGNTNLQTILQDAVYDITSTGNSIVVTSAPTGLFNVEVRQATETQIGGAEVATQAETNAGTDDSRIVTPLKLSTFITGGGINATQVSLAPAINGNTTVQAALEDAVYNIASANTSITVTQAATGQVNVAVTQATETQIGGGEVATQAETNTGTDDARFVTPLKLNNRVASETLSGIAEIATQAETNTGADDARIVTPLKLASRVASETLSGIAEIATQAETNTGTDDNRIVTPLKLKTYITAGGISAGSISLSPTINGNTNVQSALTDAIYNVTSPLGTIVTSEAAVGQLTLEVAQATETLLGGGEIATQGETNTGTDDTKIVTPLKLRTAITGGAINSSNVQLSTAINGNTNVQSALADAIYDVTSANASLTVAIAATGLVTLTSVSATDALAGVVELATPAEVVTGTSATLAVTPAGVRNATVYKSDFNAKGDILSASANDTPLILSVGTDGQYLRADSTQGTGLIWDTVSASDIVASPAINGNTNVQTILEDAIYNVASANASLTVAIAATGQVTLTAVAATDTLAGVVELATPAEVVTGTSTTLGVTPEGVRTAAVYKADFNAKGDILSADANDSPLILPVGANAQYLVADNTTATGLKWYTLPTTVGVAGGVSNVGITSITDTVTSTSVDSALSANQGKLLQDQISALLVASNLTLAGTINAAGNLLYVTTDGAANGFVVGSPLPAPAPANTEYFVICEQPGTFTPPSSPAVTVTQGDWLLSTGTVWQLLDVGFNVPIASTTQAGIVELADNAETQTGTDATRAVTPAGLTSRAASETLTGLAELATQAETNTGTDDTRIVTPLKLRTAAVYKSDYNAKGDILSASANDVPAILTVGGDGQYLRADSTQTTGLIWDTISASDLTASPAINGNTNIQTILEDAIYNVASANSSITVAIAATGQVTLTAVSASDTQVGVVELATSAEVVTGTSTTLATTPEGVRAAAVYKSDFNAKGDLLSASANDTPLVLSVGADGQVLRADSAAATGLSWYTVPSVVPPTIKNIDNISGSFNGATTAFALAIGGVAYTPNPSTNIVVYLGGVPQIPGAGNSYTVAGSTITFTEAPATGTTFYAFTVA